MDLPPMVADSYVRLADFLQSQSAAAWDSPSLCAGWRVREVVAHVTMPARFTTDQFGAELAAANGDFQLVSDTIAVRDSALPIADQLANLRSPALAAWQPPGGGAIGALNHAVVHGLDITNSLRLPRTCSDESTRVILDRLTAGGGTAQFGVDLNDLQLEADDLKWSWGTGRSIVATSGELISLLCNRTLSDGRTLNRPA